MAQALAMQSEQPDNYDGLSFDERIKLLSNSEQQVREQRKQQRLLKAAKLKIHANTGYRLQSATRLEASHDGIPDAM
jgi:hypothetical protein